jgi:hypothetical protein
MLDRIRRTIEHLGRLVGGAMLLLLLTVWVVAQQPTVGVFTRIYMGGTGAANPQIRWGAADPAPPCSKGSLYLQTTNAILGGVVWVCVQTNVWSQLPNAAHVGNDFYADAAQFGAKCDGSTDDTASIQSAITAAYLFGKAGHVVLPPGVCNHTGLVFGPITAPWLADPASSLFQGNVGFAFNSPRAGTIHFTAASSAISWIGTVLTSADIGNYVFYGPADAAYTPLGVTRVTEPTYGCTVTAILTSTTGTCVGTPYQWQAGVPLAATTGDHASFITDDHNFTIDNAIFNATAAALVPEHVGKSMTFSAPVIRAPLDFDNNPRTGSHVIFEPVPAPCTNDPLNDDWQCLQAANIKTRYFIATITSVTNPTTGTMSIQALQFGSNATTFFPDYPVHAGTGGVCGGPDPNCASFPSHEWGHLVPPEDMLVGLNPHLDHNVDLGIFSAFNQSTNSHTYLGTIFPYVQPIDTNQRYISFRGASQAATLLNFIGNDTGNAALIFSKNKYFSFEDMSLINHAAVPDQPQSELANAGAGNVDNGVHGYRVTCTYDANGINSGMSGEDQVGVIDKTVNGKILVSQIPTCGTDPLNQRSVWRTKAGQDGTGPWYHVTTIADNVTTTYTDNTADASLGLPLGPKGSTIGMYMGGLPGAGTQTLQFTINRIGIDGYAICAQLGDNLGGEISDSVFNQFALTNCDIGVRIGPGSFNTLDLTFNEFACGFNKVAMVNYEGNVIVNWGSCSFDDIDFLSQGFGPFRVENMRTEGPGIPIVGGEPGFAVRSTNVAEPQAARQIVGDVTATPNSIHTVANVDVSNVSVGVPANSFYPITFTASAITAADLRKITILPGLGPGGADVIGQIWTIDSTTTGTFLSPVAGGVVSAGTVTATLYDNALADITFPADALTPADLGASLALPNATVGSGKAVRCIVTSLASTTTGQCGFFIGNQGAGPVKPAGGTTTNPHLFVNIAAYLDGGAITGSLENNIFKTGRVVMNPTGGGGGYTMNGNEVWTVGQSPLFVVPTGKKWNLALDSNHLLESLALFPEPTGNTANGILFPWTFVNDTNQGFQGIISLSAHGNYASLSGGPPQWPLDDGEFHLPLATEEPLQTFLRPLVSFATPLNPFEGFRAPPSGPVAPMQQLSRVKQLSESGYANGRNLRILCTFATSDTVVCPFSRSEAYEVRRGVGSPTTFDPATRTYGVNVTASHFTQADVGKIIQFPACCGDGAVSDLWAYIVSIVSATNIQVRVMPGGAGFGNGITTGTATVGQNEPDALYLPAIWGANANETIWISSFSASSVTLKSSNATSTAGVLVGVIR